MEPNAKKYGVCINCGETAPLDNGDNCPDCVKSWKGRNE